jgi:methyl-accepting chemotaxis protein
MLIVGSFLNIINQGDTLMRSGAIDWWKLLLTYCVPFCVATFGAYSAYRAVDQKTNTIL